MNEHQQRVLVLCTKENDEKKRVFVNALSEFSLIIEEKYSYDEISTALMDQHFDAFFLCIDERDSGAIDQFFINIAYNREQSVVVGIGPKDKVPVGRFDFYVLDEDLANAELIQRTLKGVLGITGKMHSQAELSAMLIHDLRSPLQSVLSYLELLQKEIFGPLNEGQKQIIDNSIRLNDVIVDLVDELSDVMRFENKMFHLLKTDFNLKDLIHEVLQGLWSQADRKNLRFSVSISDDVWIYADRMAISRVLTNILTNAINYSPENTAVKAEGHKLPDIKPEMFQISITDSGPGIQNTETEMIFGKYYRVAKKKTGKGFGLGLYVSRLFVEAHGGQIGVCNNPEDGATFFFTLPVS